MTASQAGVGLRLQPTIHSFMQKTPIECLARNQYSCFSQTLSTPVFGEASQLLGKGSVRPSGAPVVACTLRRTVGQIPRLLLKGKPVSVACLEVPFTPRTLNRLPETMDVTPREQI